MHRSQPVNLRASLSHLMQNRGNIPALREMSQRCRNLLRITQAISEAEAQRSVRRSLSLWKPFCVLGELRADLSHEALIKRWGFLRLACYCAQVRLDLRNDPKNLLELE